MAKRDLPAIKYVFKSVETYRYNHAFNIRPWCLINPIQLSTQFSKVFLTLKSLIVALLTY